MKFAIEYDDCANINPAIMTATCGIHSNTCDLFCVEQCVLVWTRSGDYKKYADQSLREIMVQMAIEYFVTVGAIKELLSRTMPDRKYIDRRMINNVRIRARKKRLELDDKNIEIDPKHFDTSFIVAHKDTSSNNTKDKFLVVILFI